MVPAEWHTARVREIFKKGDAAQCCNYRPISLLNLSYKIMAALLLGRLRSAGVDDCLWTSQFGFRAGRGTADALFIIRRRLEQTVNSKDSCTICLALDWAKAFDSISPDGLLDSLRRFGLPKAFVDMIGAIYSNRSFQVAECGHVSGSHPQAAGISQGCPLSPYLFVILMSVVLQDARGRLENTHGIELPEESLSELLYADDTLLLGTNTQAVQKYLDCIVEVGLEYGLEMNWGKVECLASRCDPHLFRPDGQQIVCKTSIKYLGAMVCANGSIDSELGRRIGFAWSEFSKLAHVWQHTRVSKQDRYKIYLSCVASQLTYGLQTVVLGKVAQRKVDAFHARCARSILGIKPSYVSRVSNAKVLEQLGATPLSRILLEQQLGYFGRLARRPATCPARQLVFNQDLGLKAPDFERRRGRPNAEWASHVYKIAQSIFETEETFYACLIDGKAWREAIRSHCRAKRS